MTAIKYLHHTPGRLRIKGRHFNCHGERARKAVFALQAMPGVELVKLNAHAGSLTVHYDPAVHSQAELIAALETTGCLQAAEVHAHVASNMGSNMGSNMANKSAAAREGVAGAFGKALVGVLAQRTATRLIGALL
jgi:hypothetical protein